MKPGTDSDREAEGARAPILDSAKLLGMISPGGLLTRHLSAFQPRPGQQSMMQSVLEAYEKNAVALIEAGTGIGKSIAYLIPALLWAAKTSERTVISTHTIPLQEQLFLKDLPLLLKALGLEMQVSLVKGMGNYICLRKWGHVIDEVATFPREEAESLLSIEPWVDSIYQGKAQGPLPRLPSKDTWERISADRETCMGRTCPEYAQCPFVKDRLQAKEAQILIVNHALLFSDLSMRPQLGGDPEEKGGLLPAYSRVVLDEAHHLEDIARKYFTIDVSQRALFSLLSRVSGDQRAALSMLRTQLTQWSLKIKGEFSPLIAVMHQRLQVDIPSVHHDVKEALTRYFLALESYMQSQQDAQEAGEKRGEYQVRVRSSQLNLPMWAENLFPAMKEAEAQLGRYCSSIDGVLAECAQLKDATFDERTKGIRQELKNYLLNLLEVSGNLQQLQKAFEEKDYVRWVYKVSGVGSDVGIVQAPLDMVDVLRRNLFETMRTVVLCSATLTTDGTFDFLRGRLGLTSEQMGKRALVVERQLSPFSYATQALFAIPTDLPAPEEPEFFAASVEAIWNALEVSKGNALVLFTSYRMLLACYSALKERCAERRFPLLRQGESSRSFLLEALRKNDHSILFATYSFWEGVDIVGDALRCVIIVKLPFPVPHDPLFQAQSERLYAQGKNPFMELAVPTAMIRFIQGFGRLIRKERDRGCVVCLDTRLITRSYGPRFLHILPPCRQVIDKGSVVWQEMATFYRKTHHLTMAQVI